MKNINKQKNRSFYIILICTAPCLCVLLTGCGYNQIQNLKANFINKKNIEYTKNKIIPEQIEKETIPEKKENEIILEQTKNEIIPEHTEIAKIPEKKETAIIPEQKEKETKYGALLKYAHTYFLNHANESDQIIYYDALSEIDLDIIEFYIFPDEWKKYKNRYIDLVANIRDDGKEVYIGYKIGTYQQYKTYNDFQAYTSEAESTILEIVETLKPEYFSIVVEPDDIEKRAKLNVSDDEWVKHVDEIAKKIKNKNPQTNTIATTQAFDHELKLFRELASLESLDKIGINPYFNAVVNISPEYLAKENVIQTILEVNKNKPVWFTEVWLLPSIVEIDKKIPNTKKRNEVIEQYLTNILEFAKENDIEYISPFYTEQFFLYSSDKLVIDQALKDDLRTQAFYIYQDFVANN